MSTPNYQEKSLVKNLTQSFTALLILVIALSGLFFYLTTSKKRQSDRKELIESLAVLISRIIERQMSLGDYIAVDSAINSQKYPQYIEQIKVFDKYNEEIASFQNSSSNCDSSAYNEVTIGSKLGYGMIRVNYTNCDLRHQDIKLLVILLSLCLIFILIISLVSKKVVTNCLQPLSEAVKKCIDQLEIDRAIFEKAPKEVKPLLSHLDSVYNEHLKLKASAEKEKIITQIAHDIRSPITGLDLALESFENLNSKQLLLVKSFITQINGIANNLLTNQYNGSLRPTKTSIEQVLAEIYQQKIFEFKNNHIHFSYTPNVCSSHAFIDPITFKRIISNLLNNAVESFQKENNAPEIQLLLQEQDESIEITVKDNGKGISSDVVPHIFDGFSTKHKRIGLGLSSANSILLSWGGNLQINSIENSGTSVILTLPKINESNTEKNNAYDAVHIDDDFYLRQGWIRKSKEMKLKILSVDSYKGLQEHLPRLPKDIQIYIDSNLGIGIKGEDLALELHQQGFENLHLTTGYSPSAFKHLNFLKSVIGKTPPW